MQVLFIYDFETNLTGKILLTYKDGYWAANETEFYIATEFEGCDWGSELISIFVKISSFLLIGFATPRRYPSQASS